MDSNKIENGFSITYISMGTEKTVRELFKTPKLRKKDRFYSQMLNNRYIAFDAKYGRKKTKKKCRFHFPFPCCAHALALALVYTTVQVLTISFYLLLGLVGKSIGIFKTKKI